MVQEKIWECFGKCNYYVMGSLAYRNNIVFKGDRCNPSLVLELAINSMYEYRDQKNYTNNLHLSHVGSNYLHAGKKLKQSWALP